MTVWRLKALLEEFNDDIEVGIKVHDSWVDKQDDVAKIFWCIWVTNFSWDEVSWESLFIRCLIQ